MHSHYVQYTIQQLALIPFELLHGTLRFGEPTQNYIRNTPEIFELRNEVIRAAVYNGNASGALKQAIQTRQQPTLRTPVYDAPTK